jgi:hypothetical protein
MHNWHHYTMSTSVGPAHATSMRLTDHSCRRYADTIVAASAAAAAAAPQGGSASTATAQVLATALASGGGQATAISQAVAQAYGQVRGRGGNVQHQPLGAVHRAACVCVENRL